MGRTKALLPLGSATVLDALIDTLRAGGFGPIALVGREGETSDYTRMGLRIVHDQGGRPRSVLAGLEAALAWSPTPRILVVACDTPFVPPALFAALAAPDTVHEAVCASGPLGAEPLLAVYHTACRRAIARAFDSGDLRAIAFHPWIRVRVLAPAVQRALDPEDRAGWNLNEPGDYERARRLLTGERGDVLDACGPPGLSLGYPPRTSGPPARDEDTMTQAGSQEFAEIRFRGKVYRAAVVTGTEQEIGLDISQLRSELGAITLDPGYGNTGSCQSAITFIDGERGILRYRGYPIEELAERSTFMEVAYLLLNGSLPTASQLQEWIDGIRYHSLLHEDMKRVYQGLPPTGPPMAVCSAVVGALSTFYSEFLDPADEDATRLSIKRLLGKMPTIAAYSYKYSIGQPFMYPQNGLGYAANFLYMMFATPCEAYQVSPVAARALDQLLILHADHEQNCSTSTVRLVGSSLSNLFASISSGISALWGPLHGGANEAVLDMLARIDKEESGGAEAFVAKVKDRTSGIRLMGFGHRVYKNFDPRAKIIKKTCDDLLSSLGINSRRLEIAKKLEEIALADDYFVSRKLYPNVDFYSGIIYEALRIPVNMFTVMFTLGRLPGWIAQWREQHADTQFRIGRPRQIYTGPAKRSYVAIEHR